MPRFSSGSCPTWLSVPVLAFAGAAEETARICGPAAATSRAGTTRQVALPPVQSAAVGGAVTALPSQSTWWAPAEAGSASAAKAVAAAHAMRARPNDMRPLLPIDRPPSRGATVLDTPIRGASPPLLRAREGRVLLRRRGRHADPPRPRQHRRHRQAGRRVFVSLHVLCPATGPSSAATTPSKRS